MRLIVLASNENKSDGGPTSEISNSFNADILVKAGSKIALQSVTAELSITEVDGSGSPITNPLEEFENYYIELMDLSVESYYGFVDSQLGILNGSRKNFIGSFSRREIVPVQVPRLNGNYSSVVEDDDTTTYTPLVIGNTLQSIGTTEYQVHYVPKYPIFLDLSNRYEFALRNLSARIVRFDGSSVPLNGPISINILIKGPEE